MNRMFRSFQTKTHNSRKLSQTVLIEDCSDNSTEYRTGDVISTMIVGNMTVSFHCIVSWCNILDIYITLTLHHENTKHFHIFLKQFLVFHGLFYMLFYSANRKMTALTSGIQKHLHLHITTVASTHLTLVILPVLTLNSPQQKISLLLQHKLTTGALQCWASVLREGKQGLLQHKLITEAI